MNGALNSAIVGQSAVRIAGMAGISLPESTKVLIAERPAVRPDDPFAHEKLSPVLGFYRVPDFPAAVDTAQSLVLLGGAGHTSVLYTRESNAGHIQAFEDAMTTGRVLINMPASQGAIGDVYNFRVAPSLTLGCGSWGGKFRQRNIGVKHLMNVKTVACRRENMLWFRVPPKIYFKLGALRPALEEYKDRRRACIITDATMEQLGHVRKVSEVLETWAWRYASFPACSPIRTLPRPRKPWIWSTPFSRTCSLRWAAARPWTRPRSSGCSTRCRTSSLTTSPCASWTFASGWCPSRIWQKSVMVAIPTTSGTGSEVTPFAVITDNRTGVKYPLTDYALTPDMAIVDPEFVMDLPPLLIANAGLDVLTHAIEAYTSTLATNFADGQAMEAVRLVFKYLRRSYAGARNG